MSASSGCPSCEATTGDSAAHARARDTEPASAIVSAAPKRPALLGR